jgi:hypothetical protein
LQQTHPNKRENKRRKTLGSWNEKDEDGTIEIVSSTPYKTNDALSPELIIKVTIAKTSYFAYLRLPSMQSCSKVTFPLLQNHKRKERFSIITKYECFNSKLWGISSISMHV